MKKLLLSFLSLLMVFTLCFTVNAEEEEPVETQIEENITENEDSIESEVENNSDQYFSQWRYVKIEVDGIEVDNSKPRDAYNKNVTISLKSEYEGSKIYYLVTNDWSEELSKLTYTEDWNIPSNYSFSKYTDSDTIITNAVSGEYKDYYIYTYLQFEDGKCVLTANSVFVNMNTDSDKEAAKTSLENKVKELKAKYTDDELEKYEEASINEYENYLYDAEYVLSNTEYNYDASAYYSLEKGLDNAITKFVLKGAYDDVEVNVNKEGNIESISIDKSYLIQSVLNDNEKGLTIGDIKSITINASADENNVNEDFKNDIVKEIKNVNEEYKKYKDDDGYYFQYNLNNIKFINISLNLEVNLKDNTTKKIDNLYLDGYGLLVTLKVPSNLAYANGNKRTYLFSMFNSGDNKYVSAIGYANVINDGGVEFILHRLVSNAAAITYGDSIKDEVKQNTSTDTGSVTRTEANTPCEEWHKSKNWTWSAKANACVYRVTSTSSK